MASGLDCSNRGLLLSAEDCWNFASKEGCAAMPVSTKTLANGSPAASNHTDASCQEHFSMSLKAARSLLDQLAKDTEQVEALARWTAELVLGGARLFACGNGGSAAEAQH